MSNPENLPLNFIRRDRVAVIELNRPEALNAIDIPMRRALLAALDEAGRDSNLAAIVLTGAGKAFCSGADLKSAAANPDTSLRRTARTLSHDFQPIVEMITRLDKPVIAAINGTAAGVGMSLALACDLMIMADDASLLPSFISIGLIPDGGLAWFLTRRIGYGPAFEILAEAQRIPASRCKELNIANRVVEAASLRDAALAWGESLAERAPLAMALTKRVARLSLTAGLSETLNVEAEFQTFLARSEDAREAIGAFTEKRKPVFRGQ